IGGVRVAFGADDENETTAAVKARLAEAGHEVVPVPETDWPEVGAAVGRAVADHRADLGVVMCWTGTGVSIAANKVAGVRAALAWEPWIADGARRWNDANVLAMSLRRLAPAVAVDVLDAFLAPDGPDEDERPALDQLAQLDEADRATAVHGQER
ncbi:MAG TPA: RpiB/LacA/LacB family sugar-phosphate isomerase, partial [Mycobacteriales bacterium]|nr:RpiB/LacA/LacB family sugar-phosphate isomerase [Mycobacteriales bacterium]